MLKFFATVVMAVLCLTATKTYAAEDLENTLYLELPYGRVVIKMRPDLAPNHVARIKELAREKFYDGLTFHRVIDGFMAQGGDPEGTGCCGSDKPDLKAEFSPPYKAKHVRGVLSMARGGDPDSANSQFFIMLTYYPSLDGKYSIWGQVIKGMEFVDMIEKGEPPAYPTKIVSMRVAADVEK